MQKRERLFFSGNKGLFLLQGNASVPCTLSTAKDFFDGQMRSSQYKLQKVRGNADMDNSFLFKLWIFIIGITFIFLFTVSN